MAYDTRWKMQTCSTPECSGTIPLQATSHVVFRTLDGCVERRTTRLYMSSGLQKTWYENAICRHIYLSSHYFRADFSFAKGSTIRDAASRRESVTFKTLAAVFCTSSSGGLLCSRQITSHFCKFAPKFSPNSQSCGNNFTCATVKGQTMNSMKPICPKQRTPSTAYRRSKYPRRAEVS